MVGNDARAIGGDPSRQGTREQVHEVELNSKMYQVEVEILESTEEYFHVMVAVDDGSLPAFMMPETQSFICNKKFWKL